MSRIHGKQKCVRGTMGCPSFLELEISTTAVLGFYHHSEEKERGTRRTFIRGFYLCEIVHICGICEKGGGKGKKVKNKRLYLDLCSHNFSYLPFLKNGDS